MTTAWLRLKQKRTFKMQKIYVLVWIGRDDETGHWGEYPCLGEGFFTDEKIAQKYADYLNDTAEFDYDNDAEETPYYRVQYVYRAPDKIDD